MGNNKVHVWEEQIVLPTYKPAAPEKSPLFLENRAYQGSTGKVYPMPVTEKIFDEKKMSNITQFIWRTIISLL